METAQPRRNPEGRHKRKEPRTQPIRGADLAAAGCVVLLRQSRGRLCRIRLSADGSSATRSQGRLLGRALPSAATSRAAPEPSFFRQP